MTDEEADQEPTGCPDPDNRCIRLGNEGIGDA